MTAQQLAAVIAGCRGATGATGATGPTGPAGSTTIGTPVVGATQFSLLTVDGSGFLAQVPNFSAGAILTDNGGAGSPSFQSLPSVGPGAALYTVGGPVTPVTGQVGQITLDAQGRVQGVQQAN